MEAELDKRFEMRDLGEIRLCIGLQISQERQAPIVSFPKGGYATFVLRRSSVASCSSCAASMSLSKTVPLRQLTLQIRVRIEKPSGFSRISWLIHVQAQLSLLADSPSTANALMKVAGKL